MSEIYSFLTCSLHVIFGLEPGCKNRRRGREVVRRYRKPRALRRIAGGGSQASCGGCRSLSRYETLHRRREITQKVLQAILSAVLSSAMLLLSLEVIDFLHTTSHPSTLRRGALLIVKRTQMLLGLVARWAAFSSAFCPTILPKIVSIPSSPWWPPNPWRQVWGSWDCCINMISQGL